MENPMQRLTGDPNAPNYQDVYEPLAQIAFYLYVTVAKAKYGNTLAGFDVWFNNDMPQPWLEMCKQFEEEHLEDEDE